MFHLTSAQKMGKLKFIIPIVLLCLVVMVTNAYRVKKPFNRHKGRVVNTNVGPIRGLDATGPGGDYSMFLGIPYATVNPSNPFGPAIPHKGFKDTFNAYDDSAICPQMKSVGSLDCLHLNIHVPNTASPTNRLPVMVWIHGGSFIRGSGGRNYFDPVFLIAHDVIVVTLNYRVGIYGWFCSDLPEIPGNQGLKDQLIALRWIKNNIEAFGGDVSRITLFGQSAGSICADLHSIFSQENLFSNIILHSGTAESSASLNITSSYVLIKMAGLLGHVTGDVRDALDFLARVDPTQVIIASFGLGVESRPCLEMEFENVEAYITAHPVYADIPNARSKPVLIGFNNNEIGVDFLNLEGDPWSVFGDFYVHDQKLLERASSYVRKFYIGDNSYDEDEVRQRIANFRSDYFIFHPTYRRIKKYLQDGATSIYHYMFSYAGNRNVYTKMLGAPPNGALHGDELGYLFNPALLAGTPTPADQLMIERMTTMWTNFAKYKNPIPETTHILPVEWPVVTNESTHCMNINSELRHQWRAFHDRMAFWDLYHSMSQKRILIHKF